MPWDLEAEREDARLAEENARIASQYEMMAYGLRESVRRGGSRDGGGDMEGTIRLAEECEVAARCRKRTVIHSRIGDD
jgi:hypothetical protein